MWGEFCAAGARGNEDVSSVRGFTLSVMQDILGMKHNLTCKYCKIMSLSHV